MKVVAAAVPGGGSFTMQAVRKRDAYGEFFNPVTSVDDLRIDAGEPDTAATRIANIIRRHVHLAGGHRQTTAVPLRKLNVATIAVTTVIVAVGAVGLIVR